MISIVGKTGVRAAEKCSWTSKPLVVVTASQVGESSCNLAGQSHDAKLQSPRREMALNRT